MNASELKGNRIGFAASGGLDSCTITYWLASKGVKVVCFCADLGQPDEENFNDIRKRMLASGAEDFVSIDLKEKIAEAGIEVIQNNAKYEYGYWNLTGAARQVITKGIVKELKNYGIDIFSHGATGRGNDQIRFQLIASMIDPQLKFYAAWRDEEFLQKFKGRRQMIDYCLNHNLPIKASQDKPYSTDSNLLGLTHEGGKLENLTTPMNFVSPELGQWPIDANEQGENIRLAFRKGVPVKLNNTTIDKITLYKTLNTIGGRHGIGIAVNVIENRITGIKSRGVYESPAMTILGECYQSLLQQILDKFTLDIFTDFSKELGNRLYQGYWDDLGSVMLKNAICPVTQLVSGTIEVNLYKGNISYVSCEDVIHSIYTLDGSMENEGSFNHTDSEGLLNIYTLSVRNASKARTFGSHNDEQ